MRGLQHTYATAGNLPHTVIVDSGGARPCGINVRYALITLIGLARAKEIAPAAATLSESIWNGVKKSRHSIINSAGDFGLALWAQSLDAGHRIVSAADALRVYRQHRSKLDTVHLAWLVLGANHLLKQESSSEADELADAAAADLSSLFNHQSRLFYRAAAHGWFGGVSRRVPCFANQIYPVMALALHGARTRDGDVLKIGRIVADHLCSLQGDKGQWWWLYDAAEGTVIDGYPVFSVHQDGMAPMAFMETTRAGGRNFDVEIHHGLQWIFGNNEIDRNLVIRESGLILRDLHRRGVGRLRRAAHAALTCWGLASPRHRVADATEIVVNRECRPYHLGWVLYAAAMALEEKAIALTKNA